MNQLIQVAGYAARRLRTPRGRTRLARIIERRAPEGDVMHRDQWGFKRVARLQDDIEAQGFVGVYQLPDEAARLIAAGDWVIDAGASVDLLTAQFCHLAGPTGTVWAIEPVPYNVARLQQLKDLNGLDRLKIFAGALARSSGMAPLQLARAGETGFALFTKSWGMADTIEVPTWSLDELVDGVDRKLAFLKIDVEGYEPRVAWTSRDVPRLVPRAVPRSLVLAEDARGRIHPPGNNRCWSTRESRPGVAGEYETYRFVPRGSPGNGPAHPRYRADGHRGPSLRQTP